jgi:hypothetical protein
MQTFRLNGRPHQVPENWAELSPAQFFALAPHLGAESLATRLAVLRAWCPLLRDKDVRRLTGEQLWDVCTLVAWAWRQPLDTSSVREFSHRGRTYQLPSPNLLDAVAIEYAMANIYFQQFAHPQRPHALALDQLVATLCRPLRADLHKVEQDPEWDGFTREKYNAKLAEGRAGELADAPLGVKIVVLHHFLAAQTFIHAAYKEVFRKAEALTGPAAANAKPRHSDGTEFLELLAGLAERGLYGTYDQVAHTSLHTVLFNLAREARQRRAAERENA